MQNPDNTRNDRYSELVKMLLSGNIDTFKERLQSFIDQLPDNKRSVNKEGFFPLFCLASFLALPDTALGRELGVKEVFCRIEKAGSITKGVKLAVLLQKPQGASSKQEPGKLIFIECFDTKAGLLPPNIHFLPEEINYLSNHVAGYNTLEKVGYSIEMLHTTNKATNTKTIMVNIPPFTASLATAPHSRDLGQGLLIVKRQEKNIENWISHLSSEDKKEVKDNTEKILNYFAQEVNKHLVQDLGINFTQEYEYHGLLAGFLVMLFKYHHNLKCYTELSLGAGFADVVVLVRGAERSLNSIPVVVELKKGRKGDISQQDKDQAKKYADAFWYGPQRMITNNKDVVYSVLNCDLEEDKRLWIKADTNSVDYQPFLGFLLQTANQGEIKEQLKYIYYAIPNEVPDYYSYPVKMLLGQLIVTTLSTESCKKYVLKHDKEASTSRTVGEVEISRDITTFGFMNPDENTLVLLNIIRSNIRHKILEDKKINIDNIVGNNKDVKITEINLKLKMFPKNEKKKFEEWCIDQNIKVNSYDNLRKYNNDNKNKQSFKGQFSELNINTEDLNRILSEAVSVMKKDDIRIDDAAPYVNLLKEISKHLFNFKESINSEDDFQAIVQGVFTHYSDAQFQGGNNERISVVPEMQSGGGYRVDIGLVGKKVFVGIELKWDNSKGIPQINKDTKDFYKVSGMPITAKANDAEQQLVRYKTQPNNIKSLTDGDKAAMLWAVFHKNAETADTLIEVRSEFDTFPVVHSSMHVIQQLIGESMDVS